MQRWTNEQNDAIDTRIKTDKTNAIVSAGAGSGKTSVLTEHVIRLIESGIHVNELLVLTFTNDAANEMKTRIRNALKKEGLQEELELIDAADISTFDALNLSLVKKYHYLLNISSNVQVVDTALINAKKIKIIDEIFDKYYNEHNTKFTNLIKIFFVKSKDDKNLKKYILEISDKLDLRLDKEEYLNTYINDYFSEEKIEEFLKDYEKLVFSKLELINELMTKLSYETDTTYMDEFNDIVSNLMSSKTYEDVKINLNIDLPKATKYSEEARNIRKTIKEIIDKDLTELTELPISKLKENYLSTKEYVEIIIDILKELDKELNNFKKQNDVYEFNDIAKLAIEVLDKNKEIESELKNKYKEIIIDEYQDTSDIQESFISKIGNNNVYVVGDIKQAIYGFRNANPEIFKKKYDAYSDNINGIKRDLHGNFRSREEVIKVVNEIFTKLMEDINYLEDHTMEAINNDYKLKNDKQEYGLKVLEYEENSEYSNGEVEAFIIASDIQNKINNKYQVFDKGQLRNVTYSDFAILFRSKSSFELYNKIFTYKGIPLVQTDDTKINEENEIFLLKNSIKLILNINKTTSKEFKYAFTSIARSYLFNMSDNEIYQAITNNDYSSLDIYNKAKEINKELDHLTLTNLVNMILKEFNFYTNIVITSDVEQSLFRIDAVKKYASDLEVLGLSISEFVDYIEELIDYKIDLKQKIDNNGIGVKMMTIHTSKGLQFPICYYADLTKRPNHESINKDFLYDKKYGILTPCFDEGIRNVFTKELVVKNYLEQEIAEKKRLFYVALTRAKEDMIMVKPYRDKIVVNIVDDLDIFYKANDILSKYIDNLVIEDAELTKKYRINKSKISTIPTINKKINEIKINIDKGMLKEDKYSKKNNNLINEVTKKELEYGTLIHEQFELDDFKNPTYEATKKFLKHFDIDKAINIIKEYEFINEKHGIIDLMIEYDDHIDIIDYKTKHIDDLAYLDQLYGYKAYIETLTNKKVYTYLYSIMDDMLKEV